MLTDPFHLHRLSLIPFGADDQADSPRSISGIAPSRLLEFLLANGLAPLWFDYLERQGATLPVANQIRPALKRARFDAAAAYLLQVRTCRRVARSLGKASIPYAFYKGAHLREILYADPALRPTVDVDLLVHEANRDKTIETLSSLGMELLIKDDALTHEVVMADDSVGVDLHWDLFRPGRSRIGLTPLLLDRRRTRKGIGVLDESASLLVMLVHPAFTKHVSGRLAKLVRLVELDRLIRDHPLDWDWVLDTIDAARLRTAAWASLYWLRIFFDTPGIDQRLARLRPGRIHRRYLELWIDNNLPTRLRSAPYLVQGAFTLALQDRFRDAVAAISGLAHARSRIQVTRQAILLAARSHTRHPYDKG